MNFEPRNGQMIGRIIVRCPASDIIRPDPTRNTTKFVLIDAVGPSVAAKGLKVGDVVLPIKINTILLDNGSSFRPMIEESEVALIVRDWGSLDAFHVQSENGSEYVPFGDPRAAKSLGTVAAAA